jgi:hypothetical protein
MILDNHDFGLRRPNPYFGWPLRISDYVNDIVRQHLVDLPTVFEFFIR